MELLELIRLQHPKKFWLSLGTICKTDYWAFLRCILKLRFLDPWWHGEVIVRFIQETEGDDRIIILPREHGKTSCITVPYVPYKLAKDPQLLTKTTNVAESKAFDMARAQASIIASNWVYQQCYPDVRPSNLWSSKGYVLEKSEETSFVQRVDPNIHGIGVRGNMTGAHVGLEMHDDLINQETYRSQVELDRSERFLDEAFRCCEAQGEIIICCTRWVFHDVYGKVESGEFYAHKGPFKVLRRGIYDSKGDIVWPERTYIDFNGKRRKSGYSKRQVDNLSKKPLFGPLYLCDPKPTDDLDFEMEMINIYDRVPFDVKPPKAIGVEVESQAGGMVSTIRLMAKNEGRRFRVDELTSKRVKKDERIRSILCPLVSYGQLYVPDKMLRSRESIGEEMRQFPNGKNDDLLDALQYCVQMAKKHKPGDVPEPYISLDPAFTDEGDFSAIIAGVWYADDFWVLDARRIQTRKPEQVVRLLFRMWDKVSSGATQAASKVLDYGMPVKPLGWKAKRGRQQAADNSFNIDLRGIRNEES